MHTTDLFLIATDSCDPNQDTIRLFNGTTPLEGRLEVCFNAARWGTVCDDNFDLIDGRVVCKQLGFIGMVYHVDIIVIIEL